MMRGETPTIRRSTPSPATGRPAMTGTASGSSTRRSRASYLGAGAGFPVFGHCWVLLPAMATRARFHARIARPRSGSRSPCGGFEGLERAREGWVAPFAAAGDLEDARGRPGLLARAMPAARRPFRRQLRRPVTARTAPGGPAFRPDRWPTGCGAARRGHRRDAARRHQQRALPTAASPSCPLSGATACCRARRSRRWPTMCSPWHAA